MEERNPKKMKNILTLFGLGNLKYSASIASLLALLLFLFVGKFSLNLIILIIFLLFSAYYLFSVNIKGDPKEIIADEFAGMYVCLIIVNSSSLIINLSLFALFRVVDIVKFPPFSYLDKIKHKSGIFLDDLGIGIFLGLLVLFLKIFF